MQRWWMLVLLTLFTACTLTGQTVTPPQIPVIPSETTEPFEIFLCPRENCTSAFIELFQDAETIDCALFEVNLPEWVDFLNSKNSRVAIDEDNFETHPENAKKINSPGLMHDKFCIIDHSTIWTGSYNPTNGAFYNNNNYVIIKSKYLAENYQQEFDELWEGITGKGAPVPNPKININNNLVENYFCPEDDCQDRVLEALSKAKSSIYFMLFSFTDDKIGDLLVQKHDSGLDVKGVMEKTQHNAYDEFSKLQNASINVLWDNNPKNMHHKVFIIDNETVITGSYNPSKNADTRNDENILIINNNEEVAQRFLAEFEFVRNVQ